MALKNKLIKRIIVKPDKMLVCKNKEELNKLRVELAKITGLTEDCITFTYVEVDK